MAVETVVLVSAGLDSVVLAAHEARTSRVLPVYVSVGLAWEPAEWAMLGRLLASPAFDGRVAPATRVECTVRDVYPSTHWAIRGDPPAYDAPDEDVYLPGRNLVLLTKAGVLAEAVGATRLAVGSLAGNPFPDARPAFFAAMSRTLSLGVGRTIEVVTPFSRWTKADVIARGRELGVPMELTLSCMRPETRAAGSTGSTGSTSSTGSIPVHCGLCSKCRERRDAFAAAGVADPTTYANPSPR